MCCENKGADQLCSNCTADQRLCFRNTYSYCTADLHLCFRIGKFLFFSRGGINCSRNTTKCVIPLMLLSDYEPELHEMPGIDMFYDSSNFVNSFVYSKWLTYL